MIHTHPVLKEHIISYIIISFCAAFALYFFAPMEIYLSNKDYFFFDGKEMLSFELLATILLSAVITISLILTNRISQKLNSAFLTFGFSLVLAMYIQGNFLPNDYGALDGSAIIWSQYKLNGICSLVLFIITIVASFIIVAKCSNKNIIKVIRSVAVCWLLLQLMTLSTLFLQNNGLKKDNVYLSSTTNEMNFSTDENIIMIMLDTFESGTLTELLKQDSDNKYHDMLQDFTFYPDTSGMYRSTMFSLPYLLGGVQYKNDCTFEEYATKNYEESILLNTCKDNGWYVGVYNENRIPNSEIAMVADNCVNIKIGVSSHKRLATTMYRLVGFRYAPHQLKKFFWFYADEAFSSLKYTDDSVQLYNNNTMLFAETVKHVDANSNVKTFHFYDVFGAHPPYHITPELTRIDSETDKIQVGEGLIVLLDRFFGNLKEAGVYDNSTIIVLGDHGKEILWNPVFMVKAKNTHHALNVSDMSFSYEWLQELYSVITTSDYTENDINKVIENHRNDTRKYLKYENNDGLNTADYFTADIYECTIEGRADSSDALSETDVVFPKVP